MLNNSLIGGGGVGLIVVVLVIQATITTPARSELITRNEQNKPIIFQKENDSHPLYLRTLVPPVMSSLDIRKINFTEELKTNKQIIFNSIVKKLKSETLYIFKPIEGNLQELTKIFSSSGTHENLRSSPLGNRSKCTLSKAALIGVKNNIQKALSNVSKAHDLHCDLSLIPSDNCKELIKYIQCGVNNLQTGLIAAYSSSFDEVIKWKSLYTTLFEEYQKEIDNVKLSISQEYQMQLDTLKNNLQALQNSLTQLIQRLRVATRKLCILEISYGEIENALKHFLELEDNNLLPEIITETYSNYGKLNMFHNIINFINILPHCQHDNITYKALYDVMKENNQLSSPEILTFHTTIREVLDHCKESSSLENILREHVGNLLTGWGYKLRQGYSKEILEFCNKPSASCRPYMNELIVNAYGDNLSEFGSVLTFDDHLYYFEDKALVLGSLFGRMRINNHLNSYQILRLAYRVKKYMTFSNYHMLNQKYKIVFNTIKNSLPLSVWGIVWKSGTECTIWNLEYGGYFYAANFKYNSARRYVFTWTPGDIVRQAFWAFETDDEGKTFTIRNTRWNEYLYAANNGYLYNAKRRRVFTWAHPGEKVNQGFWILIPEDAYSGTFLIKNTVHQNYLYADYHKYSNDRRNVFTWVPEHLPSSVRNERKWRISC